MVRTMRFAALGTVVGLGVVGAAVFGAPAVDAAGTPGTPSAQPSPVASTLASSEAALADARPVAALCGDPGPKPTAPTCERYTTVSTMLAGRPANLTVPAQPCASDPRWAALEAWTLRAQEIERCEQGLCGKGSLYEACQVVPTKAGAVRCADSTPRAFDCASATPPWRAGSGDMLRVVGGRFSPRTQPGPAELSSYWLDRTEVTVAAYQQCVRAKKCKKPASGPGCNGNVADRGQHPVNCVSATKAADFCKWAGKRLPTQAEWEWAARGRDAARYHPWGSEATGARACWNGEGNSLGAGNRKGTCPVGTHADDAALGGVVDLAGNVGEWTSDREEDMGVYKGGNWSDATERGAEDMFRSPPATESNDLGFRCAL